MRLRHDRPGEGGHYPRRFLLAGQALIAKRPIEAGYEPSKRAMEAKARSRGPRLVAVERFEDGLFDVWQGLRRKPVVAVLKIVVLGRGRVARPDAQTPRRPGALAPWPYDALMR
ncbi:MAG: hypothetical protein KGS44_01675 [Alphaproteobacteria bacterium]|nr:hypothetical protein [Alphaproteobacteria bacterium]